jgi:hypothetical protein
VRLAAQAVILIAVAVVAVPHLAGSGATPAGREAGSPLFTRRAAWVVGGGWSWLEILGAGQGRATSMEPIDDASR